jgi:CRP-like cAMP-binding protein
MSAKLEDARRLLGKGALFRKLAPKDRDSLVARARMRSFNAGESIFLMGDLHDSMIAILKGEVRISIPSVDGKELILAIVYAGEVFGEIAMLDGKPRSADATALTACTLAVLDRRDVLAALDRNPEAWLGFVEVLCSRLRYTDQQLVEMALLQLPERLAQTLLRTVDAVPTQVSNRARLRLSQNELAHRVGATRESVNKCLNEWQRGGIIRIEKHAITIMDRAALEALAKPD